MTKSQYIYNNFFLSSSHELWAGHHEVPVVVQVLVAGRLDQHSHGVIIFSTGHEPEPNVDIMVSIDHHLMSPDCAGAAEDSEPLARPVLLPTQRLAGEKSGAVQLRGAAQLHKVRVTGSCQSSPRSPGVPPMSGLLGPNCHGPQLKICRE